MLKRVIGCSGSGKTEYIFTQLGEALEQGKRCFVIVPEQQSVYYETALCERFGDGVNLLCEVLNFERLPNRVAREFGGLAVNNIDKGGACALLSLVSESLKDKLKEYRLVATDADFAISLFSLISRMKMALVSPETLKTAIDEVSDEEEKLKSKLEDILLIYTEYEKNFGENLSDPRDALTRLYNELPSKPFFENTTVFIDSYYTFTEQEYAILKHIIAQSDDVFVSFTVDEGRDFFAENAKSAERIKNLSKKGCVDFQMGKTKRPKTKTLSYIAENIWKNAVEPIKDDDGSLRLLTAKNRFDEVEAVASEVLSFVRSGGRFNEVTVLAGNPEKYRTIVNSVFSRAEIPCYMSAKEDISTKPIFTYILSGIEAINDNFSLRSMKNYIKSGFCELSVSENDALLNYATRWKLKGKSWYGDADWSLDPEGYRESGITERGEKILSLANQARNKVMTPLTALRDTLASKDLTVSKAVRAIYQHLVNTNADEHLRKTAEKYLRNGERERSEREIQLWKIIINIIDQLDNLCGSEKITSKRLLALIKLMCSCYSLGAIPASGDAVTFGDASLIRANGSKLVVVLGACDGEFPSGSHKDNFFNRDEAVFLEGVGLKFADTLEKQLNVNRFFVYAALSSPAERLVLSYPKSEVSGEKLRPSAALLSLTRMFPEVNETEFVPEASAYSRNSVASLFPFLSDGKLKNSIKSSLKSNNIFYFGEEPKIIDRDSCIEYVGNSLYLSPSKFETYILCPFSYFGNYILKLDEKKENRFSVNEIGNCVHKILEEFLKECVSTGKFKRPDENDRKRIIEDFTKSYFHDVIGEEAGEDKRFMHIYSNTVKTIDFITEQLCDELSQSEFVPKGFEFKIGLKNPDIPAIEYDVKGKKVYLSGSIDRVDTYEKDGVTYVRVVDYKTYKKAFSISRVADGMDTQLLHYLFAYCEKNNAQPAGVMYYSIALPDIELTGSETKAEIDDMITKSIGRSGLFIDDKDIVFAMSPSEKYSSVRRTKGGELYRGNNLITPEGFVNLSETLKEQVCTLANEVFEGKMDVSPNEKYMKNTSNHPCKYCSYGSICRSKAKKEDDDDVSDTETE